MLIDIALSDAKPLFNGAALSIEFEARVDGKPVVCAVSCEALRDHFEVARPLEAEFMRAFKGHWKEISEVCVDALQRSRGEPVVLRSGLFRIARAQAPRNDNA